MMIGSIDVGVFINFELLILDIAAKRHKKHKNQISGLINSILISGTLVQNVLKLNLGADFLDLF